MASLTQWTWIWANPGRWWRKGKPGVLQSMGLQRVGQDLATEHTYCLYLTGQNLVILPIELQGCSWLHIGDSVTMGGKSRGRINIRRQPVFCHKWLVFRLFLWQQIGYHKTRLFASKAILLCPSPKLLHVSDHLGLYDVLYAQGRKNHGNRATQSMHLCVLTSDRISKLGCTTSREASPKMALSKPE